MSNTLKKIVIFFLSFLWIVGSLGSLIFFLIAREWVIAIGLVVVILPSIPTIKGWVSYLING